MDGASDRTVGFLANGTGPVTAVNANVSFF
jgi:hypothetical protein